MTDGPSLTIATDGVLVRSPSDGSARLFSWRWLCDHDQSSIDAATQQRTVDTFAIADGLEPARVEVTGERVEIKWADGTTSAVSRHLLVDLAGGPGPDDRVAWTAASPPPTDAVPASPLVAGNPTDVGSLVATIHRHGFALVSGLDDDVGTTEALATAIGPVRTSVFGTVWQVESGRLDHADSAYTADELEPHTDGTYSHDGPGLQILHFVEAATGGGGANVLVDGLSVYRQLGDSDPALIRVLSSVPVPAHYREAGVHLQSSRPALRLDADGRFRQISFNNYDRSPFWLPPDEMDLFYAAYSALHERIADPANRIEIAVPAGTALIVDNWRVLHGRTAFTGRRRFQGCYLNHEDFESRHRTLKGV